ncbi:MAG: OadG family protein [Bacillota bacterium]
MNPLELLRDPSLVQSMTISEKMISGLMVAILGMAIVFLVLFLLMIVVDILKKAFYSKDLSFKEDRARVKTKIQVTEPEFDDQNEKVAAIMAAIMSLDGMNKENFRIKKIKRTNDDVPIWGRVARGGGISENNKGELL